MDTTPSPMNPVGWFEIYVSDMARATKFYESVFGHPLEHLPPTPGTADMQMCVFPMNATGKGASGALVTHSKMGPGIGGTLVYFTCEDCASESARVATAGGKVMQPKMSIGEYGFIALIQDTEGNLIGMHSQK